ADHPWVERGADVGSGSVPDPAQIRRQRPSDGAAQACRSRPEPARNRPRRRRSARPSCDEARERNRMTRALGAITLAATVNLTPVAQSPSPNSMNTLAERYVKLVLALGEYDPDYV